MSDLPTDQNDDEPQADIPELRAAADRGRKAQEERDQAVRELAFVKAGIDTDSGVGKLLFESYKGEPTKDAVLAEAANYGITPGAAPAPDQDAPQPTAEEIEQTRQRAGLVASSEVPGGTPDVDPIKAGFEHFHDALSQGRRREEAAAGWFDSVLGAAANGDKRVIFDPEAHRQAAQGS